MKDSTLIEIETVIDGLTTLADQIIANRDSSQALALKCDGLKALLRNGLNRETKGE